MGAGVAGLQAIATAKRLGAIVSATDVRPAAKEQVQSLGGTFVMVENEETKQAETSGGYAKEMSEDYKRQQAALIAETIKKQDVVITTALIPGRAAPRLVTKDMVESMKTGSVIVDLAVEQGGNCEMSEAGKVVEYAGVRIIGYRIHAQPYSGGLFSTLRSQRRQLCRASFRQGGRRVGRELGRRDRQGRHADARRFGRASAVSGSLNRFLRRENGDEQQ
jgi:threonine dehydrogenase-like Zn-dependent dehydrogenase